MVKLLPAEKKELEERKLMDFYLRKVHGGIDATDNFSTIQKLLDQSDKNVSKVELERILDKIYERGHIDIYESKEKEYFMQWDGIDFINEGKTYKQEYLEERRKQIADKNEQQREKSDKRFERFLKWLSIPATVIGIIAGVVGIYQIQEIDELKEQNKELIKRIEKLEKANTYTLPNFKPKFDLPIRKQFSGKRDL